MRNALAATMLLLAIVSGTIADRPPAREAIVLGGYRVLEADFHTHSSMWSDGGLTPFGLVLEAQARGLDAFAITGHDETWDSHVGFWFSRTIGGPIVLRGEEVLAPDHHIIAVGIHETVDFFQSAAEVIDDIHAQGGIAIAAHPDAHSSNYDAAALERLDGAEICHPLAYVTADGQRDFERFAQRGSFAAIGSSDFHALGPMGLCRTYVFATEASGAGILDAIRARRTVVFGPNGRVYGDAALIELARGDDRLGESLPPTTRPLLTWVSALLALAGFGALLAGRPSHRTTAQDV